MHTRKDHLDFVVYPRPQTHRGPVAVLIDECSVFAAEVFAPGMKAAGVALPSTMDRLPSGDLFQYAFAGYVSARGKALESVGAAADVEVHLIREALLQGRDPVLETALEWLRIQE
jgi:carboxyl-terminal processing protease